MNKFTFLSCIIILIAVNVLTLSCSNQADRNKKIAESDKTDSSMQAGLLKTMLDTNGVSAGPIKILSSSLERTDYSSVVHLTFKNVSDKNISAIRFKWYGIDGFGEPANFGSTIVKGMGGGIDDHGLKAGKTRETVWTIHELGAKKILYSWPYEVAYEDGTRWKSE